MLKHLFLALALGWSLTAVAADTEYDNFQAEQGGNGPPEEITTITITVILSPSFEETTKMCDSKSGAAGCSYEDADGNHIVIIPSAEGWDDFYSFCIAGHELYHAIGANHAIGIGCPYPYVDEDNVAKHDPANPTGAKKQEKNKAQEKTKSDKKSKK